MLSWKHFLSFPSIVMNRFLCNIFTIRALLFGLGILVACLTRFYLQHLSTGNSMQTENMTVNQLRNVVVVGGSFVGLAAAKELANILPTTHRILLIEPHSHFHHLFAFPRFAIVPNHEHKAFIPYSGAFQGTPGLDTSRHQVIRTRALSLHPRHITLDQPWQGSKDLPFDYLIAATGSKLAFPGSMPSDENASSISSIQAHQRSIKSAQKITIIGGGAVGVQMACDLKEFYPNKDITLIHSREKLMPLYHESLSNIIKARFTELSINLITGTRVIIPPTGFPTTPFTITLQNNHTLPTDFAILATGQTPNTQFPSTLPPSSPNTPLTNPQNGFIRVKPTLQFQDPAYPHLFAVGDIADTGAHKAARPGYVQAAAAAKNIAALIAGEEASETIAVAPAGIHLTLGLVKNVVFRNPDGEGEPVVKWRENGCEDMNIESVWVRRGVDVASPKEYHL